MKGKRTMIFALLIEVLGVLETFNWTDFLGANSGKVLMAIGLMIAVLRTMTNSPVFSSIPGGGVDDGPRKSIPGGGVDSGPKKSRKYRPQEKPPNN